MLIKHISCILFRVLFLIISLVSLSPAPTPSGLIVSTAWSPCSLPPHCIYSLVSPAPTPSLYLQLGISCPYPLIVHVSTAWSPRSLPTPSSLTGSLLQVWCLGSNFSTVSTMFWCDPNPPNTTSRSSVPVQDRFIA